MLIKDDAPPAKKIGVRVWPKAIPQFNVGHLEVVQVRHCMHRCEPRSSHPGAFSGSCDACEEVVSCRTFSKLAPRQAWCCGR